MHLAMCGNVEGQGSAADESSPQRARTIPERVGGQGPLCPYVEIPEGYESRGAY